MTHEALVRRLQISCLGLDPIDPLRLLVDDVIEALRENAMREVQRLGQEIEQEPVDCEKLALLGWQAVECSICGSSAKAFTKPEQEPVAKVVCNSGGQISMQTLDGNSFDISKYVGSMFYTTPPQQEERNFCPRCGKRTKDIHTCTPPKENT
jgi:hypothetical protein